MPKWDTLEQQRAWFIHDACVKFGYCLPPQVTQELLDQADMSPEDLVGSVIDAEGVGHYLHYEGLLALYWKHVKVRD